MSIPATPNNTVSAVEKCKQGATSTERDCTTRAASVPDDGQLYDYHAARHEGVLRKYDPDQDPYTIETDPIKSAIREKVNESYSDDGSLSALETIGTVWEGAKASLFVYGAGAIMPSVEFGGLEQSSNSTVRRGITKSEAIKTACQAVGSYKREECAAAYNEPDRVDRLFGKSRDLVAERGSAAAIQNAAGNIAECMENLSKAQAALKTKFDTFVNSMAAPENMGFRAEEIGAWNSLKKGELNAGWNESDDGGTYNAGELLKSWTGGGGDWYAALSPYRRPAGIPSYDAETEKFNLQDPLGAGETVAKSDYPVGWVTMLSVLIGQTNKIIENTISQSQALTVRTDPGGSFAKGVIQAHIAGKSTSQETGETGLITNEAYGAQLYNLVKNGGGWFNPQQSDQDPARTVPDGVDMSPTTPSSICNVCKTAARILQNIEGIPKKQGAYLDANLGGICELIDQITKDTECIVENYQDLLDEENKIDEDIKDMADDLGLDEDNPAVQDAIAAIAAEGLTSDYFNRSKTIFKEQCWLLAYVDSIAEYKKYVLDNPIKVTDTTFQEGTAHKRLPYIPTTDKLTAATSKSTGDNNSHNASLLIDGDPYGFLNHLVVPETIGSLMDMKPHEISGLQPRIRLFKIEYDMNGDDLYEYEIPFDSHFTGLESTTLGVKPFLKRGARGTGVGIKSFNFVYDGTNPFAVKKSISANLKIFANNMNELLQERGTISGRNSYETFRYTDLAMKTGKSIGADRADICLDLDKENTVRAPLNFRLKANIGWAKPQTQGALSSNVYSALDDSYVTLNLTPTVHNFEIDEQGRVVFNINYLAYIDEFFDQSMFNIFANADFNAGFGGPLLVSTSRHIRDMRVETISKTCGQDKRETRLEEDMDLVKKETTNSLSYLITSLIDRDKIYYVNLPFEKVRTFNMFGPYRDYEKVAANIFNPDDATNSIIMNSEDSDAQIYSGIADAMRSFESAYGETDGDKRAEFTKNISASMIGANPNLNSLGFFYLSDLVDIVLMNIDEELGKLPKELNERFVGDNPSLDKEDYFVTDEQIYEKQHLFRRTKKNFESLRIILGPAEFFTKRSKQDLQKRLSVFVNLGDVPISVKYFVEFLTDKMLASSKSSYSLTLFLNDLLNNLTRDFLNNDDCFKFTIKQKTRINQTAVTAYGSATKVTDQVALDPITNRIIDKNILKYPDNLDYAFAERRIHRNDLSQAILDVSGPPGSAVTKIGIQNEFNCFVYFAARTQPTELMRGKKYQWTEDRVTYPGDHERGIFHYLLGRNRGLIKNIKLSKTETKGLAEVRYETNGYDGLEQLRVVYDVEIDCYSNVNTFPGTYIYIDPNGFAPDDYPGKFSLTDLGVGGYYMIIRSEHEFGSGYANTRLVAKWVHSIEKALEMEECRIKKDKESGNGVEFNTRCKYYTDRESQAKT